MCVGARPCPSLRAGRSRSCSVIDRAARPGPAGPCPFVRRPFFRRRERLGCGAHRGGPTLGPSISRSSSALALIHVLISTALENVRIRANQSCSDAIAEEPLLAELSRECSPPDPLV